MSLREKRQHLPKSPGCYLMKDSKNTIIYVGKAKNLKNRVSSYFQKQDHHRKTRAMVKEIRDFELIVTKTEVEALLLERTLIRHHQPRYNILLRDDKEYPFVRVDFSSPWPRIRKVRRRKDDGAEYVGPFGSAGVLNTMLRTMYKVFPLIRCSDHEFKTVKRPCNYYHMKMCLAPCHLKVDRDSYVTMIRDALKLLQGRNKDLKITLETKMKAAAQNEDFEQAAQFRDQIKALDRVGIKQSVHVEGFEDADAIGIYRSGDNITFNVLMIRSFLVIGHDNFRVPASIDNDEDTLSSFLLQYYHNRLVPDALILPFTIESKAELREILSTDKKKNVRIVSGTRGETKDIIELSHKNAKFQTEQQDQLEVRRHSELELLQETLDLETLPKRIECIDISNMQGTSIVASNVCFINGKPAKDKYRRYNIQSVSGKNDDFASIQEVVERRLRRAAEDNVFPDLIVIDGGKGQLSSAMTAAAAYPDLPCKIVSIAKSRLQSAPIDQKVTGHRSYERIFVPEKQEPILLMEGTPVHRIMTKVRDEAHRFAITFHRQKRQKRSHASVLDSVPGIGPVLKKRLFKTYGDIEGLKKASFEELIQVKGMTEKTTTALHSTLHNDESKAEANETVS